MAVYEFACEDCGGFEVTRPMAQAGLPAPCPACGATARRVFSPPRLALVDRPVRRALNLEEKSAHEPAVVTRKAGHPLPHGHAPSPPWVLSH